MPSVTEGLENELRLILQPSHRFTYVTAHSTALELLHLRNRYFTYVTWQAAHASMMMFNISIMILYSAMTAARRII